VPHNAKPERAKPERAKPERAKPERAKPERAKVPQAGSGGLQSSFSTGFAFELDQFQLEAMDALDEGHSVVVAAPTGSGKTVVAEYAVARALADGRKVFYTTPLKALSNQKFADFGRRHGSANVGLLTGDNAINGEAPVVVMTTEVLRNMVYAGSPSLLGLRYVVLDEVHYLQDPYRGPVWEEVIIHLPPEVDLVCLSATVSNAEELADWVGTVRGSTRAVIEERRPVPLHNLFLVGDRRSEHLVLLPTLVDGHANPRGVALTSRVGGGWRAHKRGGLFVPRRTETIDLLDEQGLLPAIYFIFSRAGCDEAVRQCTREGRRLTSVGERRRIREIAESTAGSLADADLVALGYENWLAAVESGFAAHHAGLVPPFREAVERCFSAGLVKVVFATETLSLGVNMPARSVVIEKLSKFSGERVEALTPGEYTQLTGRAGRRGTDDIGHAVVLWAPNVTFDQVALLAGARSYTLTSSFRPTYNMATNLVRRCTPQQAHHMLNLSFAQYRADADIVRLEGRLERARRELAAADLEATCDLGDVNEYLQLASADSAAPEARRSGAELAEIAAAMQDVRLGDVLVVPVRKADGSHADDEVAVLSTSQKKKGDLSIRAITAERRLVLLGPGQFRSPPLAVAHLQLPTPFVPTDRGMQRRAASLLAAARPALHAGGPHAGAGHAGTGHAGTGHAGTGHAVHKKKRGAPKSRAADHPVASCPELRAHLRATARAERLGCQVERLEKQVLGRAESLARQFDTVLRLLAKWGYTEGWSLTGPGARLARIYHPQDLLVAECAERGIFDGLRPAEMAGLASVFTYEARGPLQSGPGVARLPGPRLEERWRAVQAVARELALDEESFGLPTTRPPDAGFVALAHGWATGEQLSSLLAPPTASRRMPAAPISAGDLVRNVKQLIDLLRQLGDVLADGATARSARQAADALFRGVVATSSVVAPGQED
jgi:ATP-dependent RNA helicase HelY